MAKSNQDTWSYKLVDEFRATPINTGNALPARQNYLQFSQPLAYADASINSVYQFPEFQLLKNQYDRVRINSVTIQWIPRANLASIVDQFNVSSAYPQTGDMAFHTCIDRDGRTPSTIPQIQRYSSYKKFSILRGWTRTYKMTYPKSYWVNCQGPNSDASTLQSLGGLGYLGAYAEDLPYGLVQSPGGNIPLGTFKVTYNVVFQGKVMTGITINDDGSVTVLGHEQALVLPPTPLSRMDISAVGTEVPNDEEPPCCDNGPK